MITLSPKAEGSSVMLLSNCMVR